MDSRALVLLAALMVASLGSNVAASRPLPSSSPNKVVGLVACDACLDKSFTTNTRSLPGVTIMLSCKDSVGKTFYSTMGTTDKQGRFVLDAPAQLLRGDLCFSQVVRNPISGCAVPLAAAAAPATPYATATAASQQMVLVSRPFVFSPMQAHPSCGNKPAAAARTTTTAEAEQDDQLGVGEFRLGTPPLPSLPSLPSLPPFSAFPAFGTGFPTFLPPPFPALGNGGSSVFPPFPTNAPPLLPFTGFPFQFPPFFSSPPPGSRK